MITTQNIKKHAVDETIDFKSNAFPVEKKVKMGMSSSSPKFRFLKNAGGTTPPLNSVF
jgi:hypothetical protein